MAPGARTIYTDTSLHPNPSFFFFYSYRDHRDLHSFPTRRSSDLLGDGLKVLSAQERVTLFMTLFAGFAAVVHRYRSEEHTSELQSHHDLVCRLLLEKKKLLNIISKLLYLSLKP